MSEDAIDDDKVYTHVVYLLLPHLVYCFVAVDMKDEFTSLTTQHSWNKQHMTAAINIILIAVEAENGNAVV